MSSRPAHHCKPVNIVVQGTRRTKDAGMKTQLFLVAAWACALSPAVLGQIFLIQASPTPTDDENYPASLLELKEGGDVQTVSPLQQNLGPGGGHPVDRDLLRSRQGRPGIPLTESDYSSIRSQ